MSESELPGWLDTWLADLPNTVPILALVVIGTLVVGILADFAYNFTHKEDDNDEA